MKSASKSIEVETPVLYAFLVIATVDAIERAFSRQRQHDSRCIQYAVNVGAVHVADCGGWLPTRVESVWTR